MSKQPQFEPHDFRGKEGFQIKFSDGSYQLLDLYCNDSYDKDGCFQREEGLEFDEARFLSLWNQGLGNGNEKP